MIDLGTYVTDRQTGFGGIATARTEYMYGCVRILVEPTELTEEGKLPKGEWFDEPRLDIHSEVKSGGPGPVPPSRDPE
jgi:hypothetical protein